MQDGEARPEQLVWTMLHDWSAALCESHRLDYCREQHRRFAERVVPPMTLLAAILTINFYVVAWWLLDGSCVGMRSLFSKVAALLLDRPISSHPFERLLILLILLSVVVFVMLLKRAHICRDCVVAKEVSKQYLWHLRDRRYRITCDWTSFVLSEWPALRQRVRMALAGRWDKTFIEEQLAAIRLKPEDLLEIADREGLDINRQRLALLVEPRD
jgi:hypothetical protein